MKRSKPLNKYSLKMIKKLNNEAPIRIKLCKRAHGTPIEYKEKFCRNDGTIHIIKRVRCINGVCECGCGQFGLILEPHETPRRSNGGKVSMKQSKMVRRDCHRRIDGRSPMWSNNQ